MKIIDTSILPSDGAGLNASEVYWVYNALDCCLTSELRAKLKPMLDETRGKTYQQAIKLQAPFLDMMLRGVLVDTDHRTRTVKDFKSKLEHLNKNFQRLCVEGLGLESGVNWNSPIQVKSLMYTTLGMPVIKKRNANGAYEPSVDRESLEQLAVHYNAEIFCNFILAMRDLGKAIGFLETPLDSDHRIRCNFNIAGTNTGRLSSSFSDFGTGTNLQNIDRDLRYIFVPDPGKVFVNVDLEQADSRNVGALSWEMFYESHGPQFAGAYLDACESGDLHTTVCRMAWTGLDWGDDPKKFKSVANQIAYRNLSYRDLAKKLGHGTNYYGKPPTMAKHSKVPIKQIIEFQSAYFGAFPCIPEWHKETIRRLQTEGSLTHLFGRQRHFFGRLDEQSVINAAIAYCPQGMTGEEINHGILALWYDPRFELLVQVHDSILFQVDQNRVNELVPLALELLRTRLILKGGREFFVPLEAEVGWNWGKSGPANPLGLSKWKGEETRTPPKRKSNFRPILRELL